MAKITSIAPRMIVIETNVKDVAEFVTAHRKSEGFLLTYSSPDSGESVEGDAAFIALLTKQKGFFLTVFNGVKLTTIND